MNRPPVFGTLVYFVQCAATGLVKIGTTTRFYERAPKLIAGSPGELLLLGWVEGATQDDERAAHRLFAPERVHGEWFRPTPVLLAFIRNCVACGFAGWASAFIEVERVRGAA